MAVTRGGHSITMTADADAVAAGQVLYVTGITFQGSGLTVGQRLRLLTGSGGSAIIDYLVPAATDNADLWGGRMPQHFNGLLLDDGPAAGTWVLTITVG